MSDLTRRFDARPLVVVKTSSAKGAIEYVREQLADSDYAEVPLWSWHAERGLQPVPPAEADSAELSPGAHAGNAERAIDAVQRLSEGACLVLVGAEALAVEPTIQMALRRQVESKKIASYLVLACCGDELPRGLLDRVPADVAASAVDLRAAPPEDGDGEREASAALSLDDIADLDKFDTPAWTERLHRMPPAELRTILDTELYRVCVARVEALCTELKRVFVHKDDLIDLMAWCSVAHLPMLLLGTWGTGKSLLVRQFSAGLGIGSEYQHVTTEEEFVQALKAIERGDAKAFERLFGRHKGRHFEYLVTRFTTPEELLGPVNVDVLLSHAVYLRQTRALLPRAEIVFLDEVFKANSSILNALLSLINERLFYNAGLPWTVNMVMLFGASNEPPQEEELGAFYDRFPVRAMCDPVPHDEIRRLLEKSHGLECSSLLPRGTTAAEAEAAGLGGAPAGQRIPRSACVNDLRLLRRISLIGLGGTDIAGPGNASAGFVNSYVSLFRHLRVEYDISDRSCGHFFRLARARALLDRRNHLEKDDCVVLKYCGKTPDKLRRLESSVDDAIG